MMSKTLIFSTLSLVLSVALGQDLIQVTEPLVHVEGPHWDAVQNVLYYVDIMSRLVLRYDPATNKRTQVFIDGGDISPVLTVEGSNSTFVVGRGRDLVSFEWDGVSAAPSSVKVLASVEQDRPQNKFNDGKADSKGRLFVGTIEGGGASGTAGLYHFRRDQNFSPLKLLSASTSNGLAWNANDTLFYYIDSPTNYVDVFDFNAEKATISNRRHLFNTAENGLNGVPDGMTIDSEGNLWIAVWGASALVKVDGKTGKLLKKWDLPATQVSSCVWGGEDLDTLYITTSRAGIPDNQQPLAGAVFALKNQGVRGTLSNKARL